MVDHTHTFSGTQVDVRRTDYEFVCSCIVKCIYLSVSWYLVVDDMLYPREIKTSGSDVRGNKNTSLTRREPVDEITYNHQEWTSVCLISPRIPAPLKAL